MFEGYLEFGAGVEILNAERTEAYVRNLASIAFTPRFGSTTLHLANEEPEYTTPTIDDAPWYNPSEPATTDFYGLYPIEITGIDDSTLTASVTENLDDGGTATGARDGSRAIRVHGLLIGASPEGAMAGLAWLKEAVRSADCGDESSCSAGDLRYFITEPQVTPSAFSELELDPVVQRFGALSAPATVDHRWNRDELDPAMPNRLRWNFGSFGEGTLFEVGGLDPTGGAQVIRSGVIEALRHNYVLNPSVRSGMSGWTPFGLAKPVWLGSGGVDGAGAGRLVGPAGDGTFTPVGQSLLTEAGDLILLAGTGGHLLLSETDEPVGGVATTTAPMPAGPAIASIALRSDMPGPVSIAVLDAAGVQLTSLAATAGVEWTRVALPFTAAGGPVTLSLLAVDEFEFDQAMVESGSVPLAYFDGGAPDPDTDYLTEWLADPDSSVSRRRWLPGFLEQTHCDSAFRPYITLTQGSISNVTLTWWPRQTIGMSEQLDAVERVLHDVVCTQGPQVINRFFTNLGSYLEVDLIFVAGNPHPFSNGTVVSTVPLVTADWTDPVAVPDPDAAWLVDPRQPVITAPASAPVVLDPALESYSTWERSYVTVPASAVQEWGTSVPVIGIDSHEADISQVRFRFHPNPFGYPPDRVDPLAFCAEVIVSYLPARTRLVLDGMNRAAIAAKGGKATVAADHLLYGANGGPIDWPELSCGIPYVLTIDVPRSDATLPVGGYQQSFDVDLIVKRRG